MTSAPSADNTRDREIVREYRAYGTIGGGALGLIVAVVVIGPNVSLWSASTDVAVALSCGVGGALVGYLAASIARQFARGGGQALPGGIELGISVHERSEVGLDDSSASGWDAGEH